MMQSKYFLSIPFYSSWAEKWLFLSRSNGWKEISTVLGGGRWIGRKKRVFRPGTMDYGETNVFLEQVQWIGAKKRFFGRSMMDWRKIARFWRKDDGLEQAGVGLEG